MKPLICCSTSPSVQLLLLLNFSFCSTSPSVELLLLFNFSFCSTSPSVQILLLFNLSSVHLLPLFNVSFCSTSPSVQLLLLFTFSFCSTSPFSFCSSSPSVQLLLLYHIQSLSHLTLVPLKSVRVQEGTHVIHVICFTPCTSVFIPANFSLLYQVVPLYTKGPTEPLSYTMNVYMYSYQGKRL